MLKNFLKCVANNIFIIMMVLMIVFFIFYAFDMKCPNRYGPGFLPLKECSSYGRLISVWELSTFIKCFGPCLALVGLHYLSKIAMNLHEIAKQNKNK